MTRAQKTARDLLAQLPELLEPRPEYVQLAVCIKGDSNYHSFLKCIESKLRPAEHESFDRANDKPNRERFKQWVRLLVDALSPEFRHQHHQRLELLSELYKLAYGGILEDLRASDWVRTPLQNDFNEVLAGCIRNCLMRHSELNLPTQRVSLTALAPDSIEQIRSEMLKGCESEAVGRISFLLSRSACVMSDGSIMHIPMLDFAISPDEKSLDIVSASIEALMASIPGFADCRVIILNSGQSYHFCGLSLITQEQLGHFLHRALLLAPLVDARYIGHSVLDQELCLRISERSGRHDEPIVLRYLGKSGSFREHLNPP